MNEFVTTSESRTVTAHEIFNMNIMTEGTDVPDIQTVMLTRPTQSEGLLMQCIGRGMRGPKAENGTETVNIIDFHDKWTIFKKWLNPEWLIEEEREDYEIPESRKYKRNTYREYEWKMCQEIYNSVIVKSQIMHEEIMVPAGWFSLCDDEGIDVCMLVFENQLEGFLKMRKDKDYWISDKSITAEQVINKYFCGFCDKPMVSEMRILIDNFRYNEAPPTLHALEHRKMIDPFYVAIRAEEEKRDVVDLAGEIYDEYDVARDLYLSDGTLWEV